MSAGWDPGATDKPRPPSNPTVMTAYMPGVQDIRWDDPAVLGGNTPFQIVGVNIYRSDASDRGPFHRINDLPIGSCFYRDQTENTYISREVVNWDSDWLYKGDGPNDRRWVFKTKHPIAKQKSQAPFQTPTAANNPTDVTVYIDDVEVPVEFVFGPTGEITLVDERTFNSITEKLDPLPKPTANTAVEVTYFTNKNHVRSGLEAHLHYRLTTVALSSTDPSGFVETDLAQCEPVNTNQVERLDYIWREAIRRNQWILQQGGERVKVFLRKQSGIPCTCQQDPLSLEYNKQPSNRCEVCYGSGFVGGVEGPYEVLIAPEDAERRVEQTPQGRRLNHTYEVWMGPSPVVTQRDFIVKQTNERYSIGPVRRPTNRGNLLQQHFNIAYLAEGDIRYKVPIDGTSDLPYPQTRYSFRNAPSLSVDGENMQPPSTMPTTPPYPVGPDASTPMVTDKEGWDPSKEQRGRTPVWDNTTKAVTVLLVPLAAGLLGALAPLMC